jgi:acyl CoA:acetate/3-ketoacid CoA transferase beta subunit
MFNQGHESFETLITDHCVFKMAHPGMLWLLSELSNRAAAQPEELRQVTYFFGLIRLWPWEIIIRKK